MGSAAFEDLGVEEDEDELAGLLEAGVVAEGLVAVEDEPEEVVVEPVLGVEAAEAPVPVAVEFKQLVLVPVRTVNGAVCEDNPLLSRTVMSRLVPEASLTAVQVNEVPFTVPKLIRAAPLGVAPGWTLRK